MNPLPRLYHWYRLVHPRHSRIVRMAGRSERFRQMAWGWPSDRRQAWVLSRLREVVAEAASTPFYASRLKHAGVDPAGLSFEDFSRIPPLERADIAGHSSTMMLMDPAAPGVARDSTGGSTGTPTVVWKGPEERAWAEGGVAFCGRRFGIPVGARTALLWGHHLDARERPTRMDRIRDLRDNLRWFDAFRLSPDILAKHHHDLNRYRPDVVVAYGGALHELARVVSGSTARPTYPRLAFVTGAEKVHAHERILIERVFGRPVLERYGSRDVGMLAFQSSADPDDGFDVDWPNLLLEPETVAPESPILVTKLHADAFPMIRYRIGDVARFPAGANPGHPTFKLEEVLGRELERVRVGPDQWVSGTNFPHLFKDFPLSDFQVYQFTDGVIEVRVVPQDHDAWEGGVDLAFRRALEPILGGATWRVALVEQIPRTTANKRRPVISELARIGK